MKKIIKAVLCLGVLFCLSVGKVKALTPVYEIQLDKDIKIMPTNTPTPTSILIKPIKDIEIDIMPLATKTPTPVVVTQVVTATPNPTVSVTEVKPTETEEEIVDTDVDETEEALGDKNETAMETEEAKDTNLNNWFWVVIVGLLALILAVQIWSTRDKKGNDKQDDIQS